jgi:hypothetical protein
MGGVSRSLFPGLALPFVESLLSPTINSCHPVQIVKKLSIRPVGNRLQEHGRSGGRVAVFAQSVASLSQ